jgi:hypothetical protein
MTTIAMKHKSIKPAQLKAELTEVDAGVLKDIPATTSLTLSGNTLTQAQIDAKVKAYLAVIQAAETAKAQYQAALLARQQITLEAHAFYLQLKNGITAYFGVQAAQLADFGFTPAKALTPKTAAENVLKAAKAQLTRKARGTLSKKQKAAINPSVGSPAVAIGGDGTVQVTAPTVVDAALPGSAPPTGGSK